LIAQRQPAAARACLADSSALYRHRLALLMGGAAMVLAIALCAPAAHAQNGPAPAAPTAQSEHRIDPWQKMNRFFFKIHSGLDKVLIRPAAMVYRALTPGPIGQAAHNFMTNISEPAILANDLLQLRFKRAGESSVRLVANTLAGVGGLVDVAGKAGVPFHDNGFAITMGRYGIGPGPYLFVPLMGPSSVRDAIGTFADFSLDPIKLANYPHRLEVSAGLTVIQGLDLRSRSDDDLKALLADATDPYATLRSAYLQNQQSQIDDRDEDKPATPQFQDIPSEPSEPAPATQPTPSPSAMLNFGPAPHQPAVVLDWSGEIHDAPPAALVDGPAASLTLALAEAPAWR
jgi:phospholipid-binding lipoprotein MlaA